MSSTDASTNSDDYSQLIDIENTIKLVARLSLSGVVPNEEAITSKEKNIACSF